MNFPNINVLGVVLGLGTLFALWMLWKLQRSPKIDLVDLFIDTDGKASWTKITAIGAFMVASWAAAYLVISFGTAAMAYLCVYIAVYSGAPVAYRLIGTRGLPDTPQQSVTVRAPADQTVSIEAKPDK